MGMYNKYLKDNIVTSFNIIIIIIIVGIPTLCSIKCVYTVPTYI